MPREHTPDKWRRFAVAYARLGVGTKAAIEAGYSPRSAHVTASVLLRRSKVQELLGAQHVNRETHAEQTYKNLIFIADAAMREAAKVCGWEREGIPDPDPLNRARAIETAGKAIGRVAKAEGLFVERIKVEGDIRVHTLIEVAQRLRASTQKIIDAVPVMHQLPKLDVTGTTLDPANGNGNGNPNGNGHDGNGTPPTDC